MQWMPNEGNETAYVVEPIKQSVDIRCDAVRYQGVEHEDEVHAKQAVQCQCEEALPGTTKEPEQLKISGIRECKWS